MTTREASINIQNVVQDIINSLVPEEKREAELNRIRNGFIAQNEFFHFDYQKNLAQSRVEYEFYFYLYNLIIDRIQQDSEFQFHNLSFLNQSPDREEGEINEIVGKKHHKNFSQDARKPQFSPIKNKQNSQISSPNQRPQESEKTRKNSLSKEKEVVIDVPDAPKLTIKQIKEKIKNDPRYNSILQLITKFNKSDEALRNLELCVGEKEKKLLKDIKEKKIKEDLSFVLYKTEYYAMVLKYSYSNKLYKAFVKYFNCIEDND